MRFFNLSKNFSETFFILRRNERDMIINKLHVKYSLFCRITKKLEFFPQIIEK